MVQTRWKRSREAFVLSLVVSLATACGENGVVGLDAGTDGGVDWGTTCGPNLKPYKTACIPIFDDCPDSHVPIPGGGCKKIGVEECAIDGVPGIKAPPDWTCKRVGVVECKVDGLHGIKGPPDWTCKPVGQKSCAAGWTRVAAGWCEPVLPKQACPKGTKETIGKTTCQEVGDCGAGPWGKIAVGPSTVFVDASFPGTSDGSQAKPYRTLGEAIAAAGDNGHIAVAAGTYHEDVILDLPLTLEGRCPKLVRVKGVKGGLGIWDGAAFRVTAKGMKLRGLAVTGPGAGVVVEGGEAVLEQLVVQGTGNQGIVALEFGRATLRDSLVDSAFTSGASARSGASLELERVTVRGTRAHPLLSQSRSYVAGVDAGLDGGKPTSLVLKDSVVMGNVGNGVLVQGSMALVERTTIRHCKPYPLSKTHGVGITAGSFEGGQRAQLTIRDSEVAANRTRGVGVFGADGVIEGTVVRDTRPQAVDGAWGDGIEAVSYQGHTASLILRNSVVANNRLLGVLLADASGTIERTLVQDTKLQETEPAVATGVWALPDQTAKQPIGSTLVLRDSVVAGSYVEGVEVLGSTATIERTVVRDTGAHISGSNLYLRGIAVTRYLGLPAILTLRDSLVQQNRYRGVIVAGARATVERTVVRDTVVRDSPASEDDYSAGVGLLVVGFEVPTSATIQDTLVLGNRGPGVGVIGATAALDRSVLRDNRLWGLWEIWGDLDGGTPSSVSVGDCLIKRNSRVGMLTLDSDLVVERTVVRDTVLDQHIGFGVALSQYENRSPSLVMKESVVTGSRTVGVQLFSAEASFEGCAILDTRPGDEGAGGHGIGARYSPDPTRLTLRNSLVARSRGAGIAVSSSQVTVEGSLVQRTRSEKHSAEYGDGIWAGIMTEYTAVETEETVKVKNAPSSEINLQDSVVEGSARANLVFDGSGGTVDRCLIRQGAIAVGVERGGDPEIEDSTVIEGNRDDRVAYNSGLPPPPPPILPPAPVLTKP